MARRTKTTTKTPAPVSAAEAAQKVSAQASDASAKPQASVSEAQTGTLPAETAGANSQAAANEAAPAASDASSQPASDAAKPENVAVVTVIGPKRGRWRAGRRFGREPVEIPHDQLSETELEQLRSDPTLAVTVE